MLEREIADFISYLFLFPFISLPLSIHISTSFHSYLYLFPFISLPFHIHITTSSHSYHYLFTFLFLPPRFTNIKIHQETKRDIRRHDEIYETYKILPQIKSKSFSTLYLERTRRCFEFEIFFNIRA